MIVRAFVGAESLDPRFQGAGTAESEEWARWLIYARLAFHRHTAGRGAFAVVLREGGYGPDAWAFELSHGAQVDRVVYALDGAVCSTVSGDRRWNGKTAADRDRAFVAGLAALARRGERVVVDVLCAPWSSTGDAESIGRGVEEAFGGIATSGVAWHTADRRMAGRA